MLVDLSQAAELASQALDQRLTFLFFRCVLPSTFIRRNFLLRIAQLIIFCL